MKPLENTSITHQGSNTSGIARSLKKLGLLLPSSAWVSLAGFLLAAATLVLHVPSAQAAQYVRVNSGVSALNVRSGPGTQYGFNGRPLYAGETVQVVASSGGWYQLPDGGWFSAAYTTSAGGTGGPGTGTGTGTPVNFSVRATTTVNVRNGPGTQYSFNGRPLYAGETVRVVRSTGSWYQLPDGGWFSAAYTTGAGNTGGPGTGTGTPVNFSVRATTTVNVRNGPGTQYSFNGRPLYPGETVRVVRSTGSWYQLPDGGWFSATYTTGTGGTGGPGTGTGTPVNFRARATTWVNVRNGPGIGYSLNGRPLNQGEVVRVVRSTGSWYQLPDGGWFSASYAAPL